MNYTFQKLLLFKVAMAFASFHLHAKTLYMAPDGNDAKDGLSAGAAVASYDRAIEIADGPADVVEMLTGYYPIQSIKNLKSKDWNENLTFKPARGAEVTLEGLNIRTPRLTFSGVSVARQIYIHDAGDYTRLEYITGLDDAQFFNKAADHVTFFRIDAMGEIRPGQDRIQIGRSEDPNGIVHNMLIDQCRFRGGVENHIDVVQIFACKDSTFRHSVFYRSGAGVFLMEPLSTPENIRNLTWDGCYLGQPKFYPNTYRVKGSVFKNCYIDTSMQDSAPMLDDQWIHNRIAYWNPVAPLPTFMEHNVFKTVSPAPRGNSTNPALAFGPLLFLSATPEGADPLHREFYNLSTADAENLMWDFGDGKTSTDLYPTHRYAAAGTYTVTLSGTLVREGSPLRWTETFTLYQTATNLMIDPLPGPSAEDIGHVYGVKAPDFASAEVPFSGTATGNEGGKVEVRIVDQDTELTLVDWTPVGVVTNGVWSGTLTVPRSENGWAVAEARLASAPFAKIRRNRIFAAGYKIMLLGQSQLRILQGARSYGYKTIWPLRATTVGKGPTFRNATPENVSDGIGAMIDQLRSYGDGTPLMIIDESVSGTSVGQFLNDSAGGRNFSDLSKKLEVCGNDISVIIHQWGTSDRGSSDYGNLHEALLADPPTQDHSLAEVVAPGFIYVVMPLTRHNKVNFYNARRDSLRWAQKNGHVIGPYLSDLAMDNPGSGTGAHQDSTKRMGNVNFGVKMGIGLARAVGIDNSVNPFFKPDALFSTDRKTIIIEAVLPNGGVLYSPQPDDLSGFEIAIDEPGFTRFTQNGFTARIHEANQTVEIIMDDGSVFPIGSRVRAPADGRQRPDYDNDNPPEWTVDKTVAGSLYERIPVRGTEAIPLKPRDILNLGLQVMGTVDENGFHDPNWSSDVRLQGEQYAKADLPAGVTISGRGEQDGPNEIIHAADGKESYVVVGARLRNSPGGHPPREERHLMRFMDQSGETVDLVPIPETSIWMTPGGRLRSLDIQYGIPTAGTKAVEYIHRAAELLVAFHVGTGYDPSRALVTGGPGKEFTLENIPGGSLIVAVALSENADTIKWTGLREVANLVIHHGDTPKTLSIAAGSGAGNLVFPVEHASRVSIAAIPPGR